MRERRNGVTAAPRQAEHGVAQLGHFAGVDDSVAACPERRRRAQRNRH